MTRSSTPAPTPPTLAWLARDVDAISAECLACGYRREIPLAPFLDRYAETPFPDFARRLKCSPCGSRDVEARGGIRSGLLPLDEEARAPEPMRAG